MEKLLKEKTEESIKKLLDEGITTTNLEHLYKLVKINHIVKEDDNMNYVEYGNYGARNSNRGNYNEYGRARYGNDNYGARGYDRRYRGDDELERVNAEYGRYQENRERYGASEDTDKSYHYMVKALEDFIKVLYEEANTPQQRQMLSEVLQKSMM